MPAHESRLVAISKSTFAALRLYVGERIDLRTFLKAPRVLAQQPATLAIDGGGVVVLHRYGAAVFFDVSADAQSQFLATLRPLIRDPYERPESEDVTICISSEKKEGVEEGSNVFVKDGSIERLQIVAAALAKSVALAQSKRTWLRRSTTSSRSRCSWSKRAGAAGTCNCCCGTSAGASNEHKMAARVEVVDRPDLLWDHPELEQLYLRLEDEFELCERAEILERKLELISRTASTTLTCCRTSAVCEWSGRSWG